MKRDGERKVAIDAGPTHFRVPVDDETMPLLMEQAAAARLPPASLLAVIVRDVLAHAKAEGMMFATLTAPTFSKKH